MSTVTGGDYCGGAVRTVCGLAQIVYGIGKNKIVVPLDHSTVEEYEVLDATSKASAVSAIGRAGVGAAILGPVGLAAALSAKKKGSYQVAVQFVDGKRSLLALDDKEYKAFLRSQF